MKRNTFLKSLGLLAAGIVSVNKIFGAANKTTAKDKVLELMREAKKLCVEEKQWHLAAHIREVERDILGLHRSEPKIIIEKGDANFMRWKYMYEQSIPKGHYYDLNTGLFSQLSKKA